MTNNQCESYGLLALTYALRQRGYDRETVRQLQKDFADELKGLFDFVSEEEAEEKAREIIR